jgi:uncharacterized repeat protein (TIGR03803 family)
MKLNEERIMHLIETNSGTKIRSNMSEFGPGFRSTKPATSIVRWAMTLTLVSALLLIVARPAQAQTESVLYNFTNTPDGENPTGRLTLNNGNLYGTTYGGGAYGEGTVFELSPNGSGGWTETVLYSFCQDAPSCPDGENPAYAYVLFDTTGNMYGTAFYGGASGNGVVWELSPSGSSWTQKVLYSFANSPDGANPINGLVMDTKGNLYGTTFAGGTEGGNGTVFEMSSSAGVWKEQMLFDISSNGSALITSPAGYIFGTTYTSAFAMVPTSGGNWDPITIFIFNPADASKEGEEPSGTLAIDSAGNLYGTTLAGGAGGEGVIFKLTRPAKGAAFKESILAELGGKIGYGAYGGVVLDSSGNLYGATEEGGHSSAGTVYELSPNSNGSYTQTVLTIFNGSNGGGPMDSLIQDSTGNLYGTTYLGGNEGDGVVFEVNPHAHVTTTTITSSLNPSIYGDPVTFTATVTSSAGPPPNGEVVVFEPIGQSTLTNGVATFTVSDLTPGTRNITAVYSGDFNFVGSEGIVSQTVDK